MYAVKATVMGPVTPNDSPVTHLHSPPRKEAYEENMLWREAMMDWAINVQTYTYGSNTKDKGTTVCLELTLKN